MQKLRVKVKWLRIKNNSLRVICRCQLIVRLKANKYYQELLCFLSSYINLLNFLNLQDFCVQFLAPGRFQTSSPWSRPLTNSDLKGDAYTCACIQPIVWSIVWSVGRDLTAFKWVVCFVAIQSLSEQLLDLGRLVGQWFLVVCLCKLSCPLAPQTASHLRQNLSTNRLHTCIQSSTLGLSASMNCGIV